MHSRENLALGIPLHSSDNATSRDERTLSLTEAEVDRVGVKKRTTYYTHVFCFITRQIMSLVMGFLISCVYAPSSWPWLRQYQHDLGVGPFGGVGGIDSSPIRGGAVVVVGKLKYWRSLGVALTGETEADTEVKIMPFLPRGDRDGWERDFLEACFKVAKLKGVEYELIRNILRGARFRSGKS